MPTITEDRLNSLPNQSIAVIRNGKYNITSIKITNNITIEGTNPEKTILTSNNNNSMFIISKTSTITFKNLTFTNSQSTKGTNINNNGTVNISNCIFDNNTAINNKKGHGGSIYNNGILNIKDSLLRNNYADFGAAIYNNNAISNINNCIFQSNTISNVGGAIYTFRSNITITNSLFVSNVAVSGAAIYNAFGIMNINNTRFYENSAESFYGGAIYSTGITTTTDSDFINNHANYNGGAITTTSNFTAINCTFKENNAGLDGGVIENVPWTEKENGNLTLINCIFNENSAGRNGGVIVNLLSTYMKDNQGTVTSKNCSYSGNSATKGGVIYNENYINFEYNVFINNEADSYNTICSNESGIRSIEKNWWGENNPSWSNIGVTPNTWIIMTFTNKTVLFENLKTELIVTLNTLNNGELIQDTIPTRTVYYYKNTNLIYDNVQFINLKVNNTYLKGNNDITAQIDNQQLTLHVIPLNITYYYTNNNSTMHILINTTNTVNVKLVALKVNGITIVHQQNLSNNILKYTYTIPINWTQRNYTLTTILKTDNNKIITKNQTIQLGTRLVKTNIDIKNINNHITPGNKIIITGTAMTNNQYVNTGKVSFKLNGKTICSNVKIVNGKAVINYTISSIYKPGLYNITMIYSGDKNKQSNHLVKNFTIDKHSVFVNSSSSILLKYNTKNILLLTLHDENNNSISYGKVCYKVNGRTIKTNITIKYGYFYFEYIPTIKENQILTIKYGENSLYTKYSTDIKLLIE